MEQQKDYMDFFPIDIDSERHIQDPMPSSMFEPFSDHQQLDQQSTANQLSMEMLGNMMAIQGLESQAVQTPRFSSQLNPQIVLEQQFKLTQLTQLQQLQNQIFQQQIALISGTHSASERTLPDSHRDMPVNFHGLPTPGPSAELRAQQSNEYVSPMILHYDSQQHDNYLNADKLAPLPHHSLHAQYAPRGSTSAPAHIAFRTSPSTTTEMDFESISPLTSPWLGAHQQDMPPPSNLSHKRTASPSDSESTNEPSRKKQSPAIRPTNPLPRKSLRGSRSVTSTPLMRSTRSRRSSTAADVHDSPSPVDLSMPPPAPPSSSLNASTSASNSQFNMSFSHPNSSSQLTPVTPASIMNLGHLGLNSNLTPTASVKDKAKATRLRSNTETKTRAATKKSTTSPAAKAVPPVASGSMPPPLTLGASASAPQPAVKKTSHKAAEQKRRDSLKTTFDDLRVLLPPLPLPSDDNFPEEQPLLPGALPPRGPPKSGGEGPNKGVSKLQLLMCGNDYIRLLKGRVERREDEIDKLRAEIRRLRLVTTTNGIADSSELDLDRNLDEVEVFGSRLGSGVAIGEADEDGDEGEGED